MRVWPEFCRGKEICPLIRAVRLLEYPLIGDYTVLENSSKNQANLDANQISLKDPIPLNNVEIPQPKHVIQNKNKPEEEINALKLEAQLSALKSYMNCEL